MISAWELINRTSTDITQRMPVPGGWLVCRISGYHLPQALANWFVPDPEHLWQISEPIPAEKV